jgi:ABC-type phosphate/phosphonate transport system permease subunit
MMVGASLMLGWTVLLIWADRKPVERKGIILITIIPVVIGMILAGIFAVCVELIQWENMLPTWILQLILLILFLYSYIVNSKKTY